jgi:uncharacterized membrane protein YdjX (TVP38/TMEM64 family)
MSPLFKKRVALLLRIALLVGVFVGLNGAADAYGLKEYLDPDRLRAEVDALGPRALLLYFAAWILLHVPTGQSFLPTAAGAIMFGWVAGGLLAVVGLAISATIQFLIVRHLLRGAAQEVLEKRFPTLGQAIERRGLGILVMMRFLGVPPPWMANVAAALTTMPTRTFLTSFWASFPLAIITCLGVDSVFTYGWRDIPAGRWALFLGLLVASLVAYQLAKRRWPELGGALQRGGEEE